MNQYPIFTELFMALQAQRKAASTLGLSSAPIHPQRESHSSISYFPA